MEIQKKNIYLGKILFNASEMQNMKLTSTQPAEESPCNGSGKPGRGVYLEKQPSRSQDARLQGDLVLVGADHLDKGT